MMNAAHMLHQVTLLHCFVRAEITREHLDVTNTMSTRQVQCQGGFLSEALRAAVTRKRLDVTKAVNSRQMLCQLVSALE